MTAHQLDLVRTAMTADDRLDDLARVRIWNALAANLADDERGAARATDRRRRTIAIATTTGIATAALAAAIAFVLFRPTSPARVSTVAADTTLTLPLGPFGRAAVVGPARFELVGPAAAATTVRVDAGTLLAEFSGGPGRSLRIVAPDVTVEVVGTLFAVDVRAAQTCVSVEHGTVRVTAKDRPPVAVTGGQTYCARSGAQPLAPGMRDALLRHERVILASTSQQPSAAPAPRPETPLAPTASAPVLAPAGSAPTSRTVAPPTPSAARTTPPTTSSVVTTTPAPTPAPRTTTTSSARTSVASTQPTTTTSSAPTSVARTQPAPTTATTSPDPTSDARTQPAPSTSSDPTSDARTQPAPSTESTPTSVARMPPAPTTAITSSAPTTATSTPSAAPTPASSSPSSTPPTTPAVATTPAANKPAAAPTGPDELYRQAEAALARDPRAADRLLARLVTQHPRSPLVEQALYDRARIAYQQRAWAAARKHVEQLLALPSPRLVEQARFLDCRIAVATQDNGASACLDAYRRAYPRSPHAADVLAMLAQLDHAAGGCRAAAARIGELEQRHPGSKLAVAWRARCPATPEGR